jgi:lipid-binding SYLF domain-containing protein
MKQTAILIGLGIILLTLTGCGPSPKQSVPERQAIINTMADYTLDQLYADKPSTRQEIMDSVGYAVFSNTNVYLLVGSLGGGNGVVMDKSAGDKVYMKKSASGIGPGIGAKDYRQVVIFRTRRALLEFIGSGWEVGGQAGMAVKGLESGKAATAEESIHRNITTYTITDSGLALQANIIGARYWIDEDLNQPGLMDRLPR